ncbi:hypothetical protein ACFUJR_14250 [Streptomyces sp. NPDC057271]|uniref:hypothetical protein n=1 Tax=unclassified Streptomyces TaxID=2593676 RepID=UPI00363FDA1D
MSEKSVRFATKFAAALALVALPTFGIAAVATHESAPATSVASTGTNGQTGSVAVEPTPAPTTSKDTTGWD